MDMADTAMEADGTDMAAAVVGKVTAAQADGVAAPCQRRVMAAAGVGVSAISQRCARMASKPTAAMRSAC